MRAWGLFVRRSFRRGWHWLTAVGNHAGAAALLLGGFGSVVLGWTTTSWWIAASYGIVVGFLCFSVGAFKEWSGATRVTAGAMAYVLDGWIKQLEGERGRAGRWLELLRDQSADPETIEYVFNTFWLPTLRSLIEPRGESVWAKFADTTHDPLPPAAQTTRERVFDRVTLTIAKLDAAIADIREARDMYHDLFPDLDVSSPLGPLSPWRER